MSFPLYYLLLPYALFLIIWGLLGLVGIYHLVRFGFRHIGLVLIVLLYLGGSAFILQISYQMLAPLDWQQSISAFTSMPSALPSFGTSY